MSKEHKKKIFKFKAEITQLLNLIVNAFYSKKDIFLRELISNSSDALDKFRVLSITNKRLQKNKMPLKIDITSDINNNTLTIYDTGIGMSYKELINNLGTIANSGTKTFIEEFNNDKNVNLIGKFGVGFYSVYLVSNKVEVITKQYKHKSYKWTSSAEGTFTVEVYKDKPVKRGTKIILYLKDECSFYIKETNLIKIINNHSSFVNYPINLLVNKKNLSDTESSDNESIDIVNNKIKEYTQLNKQKPLWLKDPKKVSIEEYKLFYKSISSDFVDYSNVCHFKIEGSVEFKCILFIPSHAPFDMFEHDKYKKKGIKLYVRRVFITDDCNGLVPDYLNFIKGIIDADDIPLNVSREILQENDSIKIISKHIVKKCLNMFKELSKNEKKYLNFYKHFSKNIKLGINDDSINRNKLVEFLRFETTHSNNKLISLNKYVKRMNKNQRNIYYISGESVEIIKNSPFLEELKKRDFEVLYLVDPIDEYVFQQVTSYKKIEIICITKENIRLKDTELNFDNIKSKFRKLCIYIKDILKDKVDKVIVSNILVNSPSVLATTKFGWSANMQRIMKAQTLRSNNMNNFMMSKKIMKINPNHSLIIKLNNSINSIHYNKSFIKETVDLLYDTSLLTSGFNLNNPTKFSNRIYNVLEMNFVDNKIS